MTATCATFRDRDTAARWVAGTLRAAEAVAFEDHMVACTTCQADVRLAATVRGTLVRRRPLRWTLWGGLAAAAVLLVVLVTGDETAIPKTSVPDVMTQARSALAVGDTARALDLLRQIPPSDSLGARAAALVDSISAQQKGSSQGS